MGFNDKARRHYGRPPRVFIVLCTGLALGLAVAHFSVRPKSRANVQCPPCPACPACICQQPEKIAVGHASQRKAREQEALFAAIDKYFGYESPFVDYGKVGNHTTNFQLLSSTVFPVARPDVLELWRSLQPYTQHYKHGGNNGMFGECDGAVLYAMVRKLQPARIYEVGSGFSTQVAHAALKDVAAETGKMGKHLCIEPYRAAVVRDTLGSQVHIIQQPIQEVALSLFDDLQAGDLLFLDNAHIIRPYGDVILELLWIMPRLKAGVYVHLHDIFLPFDYPAHWMRETRQYTEQYMLAAFLYKNSDWEVVFHNGHLETRQSHVLTALDKEAQQQYRAICSFTESMLIKEQRAPPGSIYLRKLQ